MAIFITSDLHFDHKNILDFEYRPYRDIETMKKDMIANWNKVVSKVDTVYLLGDFSFGNVNNWIDSLNQLRGNIIFIKGNHDKTKILNRVLRDGYIQELHNVGTMLRIEGQTLNLTHYPMDIGNRPNNWSIHGHLHSHKGKMLNQINIGVDSLLAKSLNKPFGTPISIDELVEHLHKINPLVENEFMKERLK